MNKIKSLTVDGVEENIAKIGELFPNVIVETTKGKAIDFDLLKQELSKEIVEGNKEKYQLTWPGKTASDLLAKTPTSKTLRPLKDKSVDFENTGNIYIEGDNLEALKILKESYLNKIKCIYIDPPYNTGNDFIYRDNFHRSSEDELLESGQIDEEGNKLTTNFSTNGRYHSDWLSMMYPRLKLARDLLTDDGVIFISIDDNEQANLKKICDEVFGPSNFVAELIHQRAKGGGQAKYVVKGHDYILVYARNLSSGIELRRKKVIQQAIYEINGKKYIKNDDVIRKVFGKYDKEDGDRRCFYEELVKYKGEEKKKEVDRLIKDGKYFLEENKYGMHTICEYIPLDESSSKLYSIIKVLAEEGKKDLEELGLSYFDYPNNLSSIIKILSEEGKIDLEELGLSYFDYPKPVNLICDLIQSVTLFQKDCYVLDFFSGSATTGQAVMKLNSEDNGNRKYILVQIPEECNEKSEAYKNGYNLICEVAEERLRRAAKKIKEETNANIDYGFRVYKIDSSNMKNVESEPGELIQSQLDLFETNIKEDRTSDDLLTHVILRLGLTLDMKIEEKNILNNKVYYVDDNSLVACFDDNINMDIIDEICKCEPVGVVFKDNAFKYDNDKINLQERFKKLSPSTKISIL